MGINGHAKLTQNKTDQAAIDIYMEILQENRGPRA